jgi:hypothetical protein
MKKALTTGTILLTYKVINSNNPDSLNVAEACESGLFAMTSLDAAPASNAFNFFHASLNAIHVHPLFVSTIKGPPAVCATKRLLSAFAFLPHPTTMKTAR